MLGGSDILQTIAEIAVGFAGFTGIVVGLGEPASRKVLRFHVMTLLYCSLATLFFSLLPIVLFSLGMPEEKIWRSVNVLLVLGFVFTVVRGLRSEYVAELEVHKTATFRWTIRLANIACFAVLVLGVTGELPAYGTYVTALVWLLCMSGVQFSQLVTG